VSTIRDKTHTATKAIYKYYVFGDIYSYSDLSNIWDDEAAFKSN